MGSKYTPQLKIPEGLGVIMKDFTREVLRNQLKTPQEIYDFGVDYFSRVGGATNELLNAEQVIAEKVSGRDLKSFLEQVGSIAEEERLSRDGLSQILQWLSPDFDTKVIIDGILAHFDVEGEGSIPASTFIVAASTILEGTMKQKLEVGFNQSDQERKGMLSASQLADLIELQLAGGVKLISILHEELSHTNENFDDRWRLREGEVRDLLENAFNYAEQQDMISLGELFSWVVEDEALHEAVEKHGFHVFAPAEGCEIQ